MMRRWCVLLAMAIGLSACGAPGPRMAPSPHPLVVPRSVTVFAGQERGVRTVALEDYVRAAILSEFAPPGGDPRVVQQMFEVQAIIARSYAVANRGRHERQGYDLCSTSHCQLYEPSRLKTSRWRALAVTATERTAGQVLWHRRTPVNAVFHADCGGHTRTSAEAWGGAPLPYLVGVPDAGAAAAAHQAWAYRIPLSELSSAVNADARLEVGRLRTISIRTRDRSGRAATIVLHGERDRTVRGEDFRAALAVRLGARAVKSTLFSIRLDGEAIVFEGRGFGHGVGLCQAGALARLRAGESVAAVLTRYYPGTALARAD